MPSLDQWNDITRAAIQEVNSRLGMGSGVGDATALPQRGLFPSASDVNPTFSSIPTSPPTLSQQSRPQAGLGLGDTGDTSTGYDRAEGFYPGGLIPGEVDPSTGDDTTIPAKRGEYVIPTEVVGVLGKEALDNLVYSVKRSLGLDEPPKGMMPGAAGAEGFEAGGWLPSTNAYEHEHKFPSIQNSTLGTPGERIETRSFTTSPGIGALPPEQQPINSWQRLAGYTNEGPINKRPAPSNTNTVPSQTAPTGHPRTSAEKQRGQARGHRDGSKRKAKQVAPAASAPAPNTPDQDFEGSIGAIRQRVDGEKAITGLAPNLRDIGAIVSDGSADRGLTVNNGRVTANSPMTDQESAAVQGAWAKQPINIAERQREQQAAKTGIPAFVPVGFNTPGAGGMRSLSLAAPEIGKDGTARMPGYNIPTGQASIMPGLSPKEYADQAQKYTTRYQQEAHLPMKTLTKSKDGSETVVDSSVAVPDTKGMQDAENKQMEEMIKRLHLENEAQNAQANVTRSGAAMKRAETYEKIAPSVMNKNNRAPRGNNPIDPQTKRQDKEATDIRKREEATIKAAKLAWGPLWQKHVAFTDSPEDRAWAREYKRGITGVKEKPKPKKPATPEEYLKAHPDTWQFYDQRYGTGKAKKVLEG